jgi:hypothetical protein
VQKGIKMSKDKKLFDNSPLKAEKATCIYYSGNERKKLFEKMDDFLEVIDLIEENEEEYLDYFNNLSIAHKNETINYIKSYMIPNCKSLLKDIE